jgi:hypothetical protein
VAFNILNAGRFSLGAYCTGGQGHAGNRLEIREGARRLRQADRRFRPDSSQAGRDGHSDFRRGVHDLPLRGVDGPRHCSSRRRRGQVAAIDERFEEYAIESSISKVYGSELLDYVVDEAVQIFGGYGFHEDYPVARAYRDSRVNRIFEGTNEINRMLIIQMLMKRATSGALPLMQAGAKLREEILAGPSFEELRGAPGLRRSASWPDVKKAFLLVAGAALEKYRDRLADQQEIVAALSDIVMECYAIESSLRRVQKGGSRARRRISAVMADAARVFLHDAADRVEIGARKALAAVLEGDMLRTQLAVLRRFLKRDPADTVAMRKRVCAGAIRAGGRPLSVRGPLKRDRAAAAISLAVWLRPCRIVSRKLLS